MCNLDVQHPTMVVRPTAHALPGSPPPLESCHALCMTLPRQRAAPLCRQCLSPRPLALRPLRLLWQLSQAALLLALIPAGQLDAPLQMLLHLCAANAQAICIQAQARSACSQMVFHTNNTQNTHLDRLGPAPRLLQAPWQPLPPPLPFHLIPKGKLTFTAHCTLETQ